MSAALIFLAALILAGLSALTMRKTTALGRVGGAAYEKRRRRRIVGEVLAVAATILSVVGAVALYYSSESADSESADIVFTAIAPPPDRQPTNSAPVRTPPRTPAPPAVADTDSSAPAVVRGATAQAAALLNDATTLFNQKQIEPALDKVNTAIITDPKLAAAYALRASIYVRTNDLDRAEGDYQTFLSLDPDNVQAKFDMAQLNFLRKKYDAARQGFLPLQQDPDLGDLSAYKVFLCDLLGGHESTAAKELDAFNQVGSNASYYFANIAWALYHQKMDEARDWQNSAHHIYSAEKFNLYAGSLVGIHRPAQENNSP